MKKAFSLAEMLVSMAVIGVIAAVTLSVFNAEKPNEEAALFRKAYNMTAKLVYDMIMSSGYYKDNNFEDTAATEVAVEGPVPNPEGTTKFCQIFSSFVNTTEPVDCRESSTFKTLDGMIWSIPPNSGDVTITVDVTGKGAKTFPIHVSSTGKIDIPDATALSYLQRRNSGGAPEE